MGVQRQKREEEVKKKGQEYNPANPVDPYYLLLLLPNLPARTKYRGLELLLRHRRGPRRVSVQCASTAAPAHRPSACLCLPVPACACPSPVVRGPLCHPPVGG